MLAIRKQRLSTFTSTQPWSLKIFTTCLNFMHLWTYTYSIYLFLKIIFLKMILKTIHTYFFRSVHHANAIYKECEQAIMSTSLRKCGNKTSSILFLAYLTRSNSNSLLFEKHATIQLLKSRHYACMILSWFQSQIRHSVE